MNPRQIYDLRLQRYVDWLVDEVHPSLDVEVGAFRTKRARTSLDGAGQPAKPANGSNANGGASPAAEGAQTVARQLDVLNNRYETLLNILLERLRQLAAMVQDPQLQVSPGRAWPSPCSWACLPASARSDAVGPRSGRRGRAGARVSGRSLASRGSSSARVGVGDALASRRRCPWRFGGRGGERHWSAV